LLLAHRTSAFTLGNDGWQTIAPISSVILSLRDRGPLPATLRGMPPRRYCVMAPHAGFSGRVIEKALGWWAVARSAEEAEVEERCPKDKKRRTKVAATSRS
jgi:hypothetical protein